MCKSDQWVLLSRAHAEEVLRMSKADPGPELWRAFATVTASDEWFFPCCLATLGHIDLTPLNAAEAARLKEAQRLELYGSSVAKKARQVATTEVTLDGALACMC